MLRNLRRLNEREEKWFFIPIPLVFQHPWNQRNNAGKAFIQPVNVEHIVYYISGTVLGTGK